LAFRLSSGLESQLLSGLKRLALHSQLREDVEQLALGLVADGGAVIFVRNVFKVLNDLKREINVIHLRRLLATKYKSC